MITLTDATVANDKNIEEFCLLATGHNPTIKQISKDAFTKTAAWFDSEEPEEESTVNLM